MDLVLESQVITAKRLLRLLDDPGRAFVPALLVVGDVVWTQAVKSVLKHEIARLVTGAASLDVDPPRFSVWRDCEGDMFISHQDDS